MFSLFNHCASLLVHFFFSFPRDRRGPLESRRPCLEVDAVPPVDATLVRLLLKDDIHVLGDIVCDLDGFENFGENSRALNVHLRVLTATSGWPLPWVRSL